MRVSTFQHTIWLLQAIRRSRNEYKVKHAEADIELESAAMLPTVQQHSMRLPKTVYTLCLSTLLKTVHGSVRSAEIKITVAKTQTASRYGSKCHTFGVDGVVLAAVGDKRVTKASKEDCVTLNCDSPPPPDELATSYPVKRVGAVT